MTKPIAFVTGYHDGYPVVQPTDGAAVLPVGMALYTHPAPDVQPVAWRYKVPTNTKWLVSELPPEQAEEWNIIVDEQPLYPHPPAADVAELVEALKWIEKRCNEGLFEDGVLHQEHWKAAHDAGACARAYLKKWEGK